MREIEYNEIPEAYRAETLTMAEEYYGAEPTYTDADWALDNGINLLDLDMALYPEDFVSESDFNAATPTEWEGIQAALDWEQTSHTL